MLWREVAARGVLELGGSWCESGVNRCTLTACGEMTGGQKSRETKEEAASIVGSRTQLK